MVIFHSYVSLPEGTHVFPSIYLPLLKHLWWDPNPSRPWSCQVLRPTGAALDLTGKGEKMLDDYFSPIKTSNTVGICIYIYISYIYIYKNIYIYIYIYHICMYMYMYLYIVVFYWDTIIPENNNDHVPIFPVIRMRFPLFSGYVIRNLVPGVFSYRQ